MDSKNPREKAKKPKKPKKPKYDRLWRPPPSSQVSPPIVLQTLVFLVFLVFLLFLESFCYPRSFSHFLDLFCYPRSFDKYPDLMNLPRLAFGVLGFQAEPSKVRDGASFLMSATISKGISAWVSPW